MKELNSIVQFFSEIDCHFQCYDMGRLIQAIDNKIWRDFEKNSIPWPSPFMQHAWLGLIFWQKNNAENKNLDAADNQQDLNHTVWFLKLPLDEQAQLNLVARDDFLRRLFASLEHYLQQKTIHNKSTDQVIYSLENAMKDNPYGFQPKQEAMANFHAIVHKQLGLAASSYYHATQNYLAEFDSSDGKIKDWQHLGIQGFADFSARLDEKYQGKNNQKLLINTINQLPIPVLRVLGLCLENHKVSKQLQQTILEMVTQHVNSNSDVIALASICSACIRICAQGREQKLQTQLIQLILTSPVKTDIEVLASISGRCWIKFYHDNMLFMYLETLAAEDKEQNLEAFSAILSDLMFIPGMREKLLKVFRSPERSIILAEAIKHFLNLKLQKNTGEIH